MKYFMKEKLSYDIYFRGIQLKHKFYADFVVMDKIILEIKSCNYIIDEHISQTINYLKASGHQLGLFNKLWKRQVRV